MSEISYTSLEDFVKEIKEVEARAKESDETLSMIQDVAKQIKDMAENNSHILIRTDSDADGICSGRIAEIAVNLANSECKVDVEPSDRRFGYGILENEQYSNDTACIVLDMGTNQLDLINEKFGANAIVIDHHVPENEETANKFMNNDNFCNPHCINQDDSQNAQYCTSGLVYRVLEEMKDLCPDRELDIKQENEAKALASIGTVTDMVNVIDEHSNNRAIIKEGIDAINNATRENFSLNLGYILSSCNISEEVTARELSFKVGSFFNSASKTSELRKENGAKDLCTALSTERPRTLQNMVFTLHEYKSLGDKNKGQITQDKEYSDKIIEFRNNDKNIAIYTLPDNASASLTGSFANKFANAVDKPTLCFKYDEETQQYRGSGRNTRYSAESIKDFISNVKNELGLSDEQVHIGGHHGACGITVDKSVFEEFTKAIDEKSGQFHVQSIDEMKILKMDLKDIQTAESVALVKQLEPLGIGLKLPPVEIDAELPARRKTKGVSEDEMKNSVKKREFTLKVKGEDGKEDSKIKFVDYNYHEDTGYVSGDTPKSLKFLANLELSGDSFKMDVAYSKAYMDFQKELELDRENELQEEQPKKQGLEH